MAAKLQNSLTIWVAEDNQNDQFFLRHAFSELASRATLIFFERSEDLIAALNEWGSQRTPLEIQEPLDGALR